MNDLSTQSILRNYEKLTRQLMAESWSDHRTLKDLSLTLAKEVNELGKVFSGKEAKELSAFKK